MNFELKIKRIEEILGLLQEEKTDFEESLKLYEEASLLIKQCYETLKMGGGKIQEIGEELKLVDFKLD